MKGLHNLGSPFCLSDAVNTANNQLLAQFLAHIDKHFQTNGVHGV